jgi:hypothetical protein
MKHIVQVFVLTLALSVAVTGGVLYANNAQAQEDLGWPVEEPLNPELPTDPYEDPDPRYEPPDPAVPEWPVEEPLNPELPTDPYED